MKGQSAIEYLATYGWMILAVAVVGGVAYSNINQSCTRSSADFYSDAIDIDDFGVDGNGNFVLSVQNSRFQDLRVNNLNISIDDRQETFPIGKNISSGGQEQLEMPGFSTTTGCKTMQINIFFDRGTLTSQQVTGVIRAPIGFNNSN